MDPHHDRFLLSPFLISLPDIQMQAVLTLGVEAAHLTGTAHLAGNLPEVVCLIHAVVRSYIHRCLPAQVPDRLLSHKGYTLVCNDIPRLLSDKSAVDALDSQRTVIIPVCNFSVLSVQSIHLRCRFIQSHHYHSTHCFNLLFIDSFFFLSKNTLPSACSV